MKQFLIFLLFLTGMCFSHAQYKCRLPLTKNPTLISDTLTIGYTYWWPQSGPFLGNCGSPYALAFIGTVVELKKPVQDATLSYIPQKGSIRIDSVLTKKALEKEVYATQTYITTDCFDGLNYKKGDQVLVFCYEYEGSYAIPGGKSILRIEDVEDSAVHSIQNYITSGYRATAIKKDIALWKRYKVGDALLQLLECEQYKQ